MAKGKRNKAQRTADAASKESASTQHAFVLCDLEFPGLRKQLDQLTDDVVAAVIQSVEKIGRMTWAQVYATSTKGSQKRGLNYEPIPGQKTKKGSQIHSIRITKRIRARVVRDGAYMRFISIHPDHDEAYSESGGEGL